METKIKKSILIELNEKEAEQLSNFIETNMEHEVEEEEMEDEVEESGLNDLLYSIKDEIDTMLYG